MRKKFILLATMIIGVNHFAFIGQQQYKLIKQ
jgi:hypothetical protein